MKRIVFFPLLAALLVGCNNNRLTPDPGSEEKQAELSEKALVSILTESHYAPNEFAEALGAPSMTALLEEMVPGVLPWAQALMKAKVLSHLPALDRQFAKECGTVTRSPIAVLLPTAVSRSYRDGSPSPEAKKTALPIRFNPSHSIFIRHCCPRTAHPPKI